MVDINVLLWSELFLIIFKSKNTQEDGNFVRCFIKICKQEVSKVQFVIQIFFLIFQSCLYIQTTFLLLEYFLCEKINPTCMLGSAQLSPSSPCCWEKVWDTSLQHSSWAIGLCLLTLKAVVTEGMVFYRGL